jgi:hypothetical protein
VDPELQVIFNTLYDYGGYNKLGLSFILIPLLCWMLFYFVWRYPYGTYKHWLISFLITIVIVFSASLSIARIEILASSNPDLINAISDPQIEAYARSLPVKYAFVNGFLTILLSAVYSLILKQFSKVQAHLPI